MIINEPGPELEGLLAEVYVYLTKKHVREVGIVLGKSPESREDLLAQQEAEVSYLCQKMSLMYYISTHVIYQGNKEEPAWEHIEAIVRLRFKKHLERQCRASEEGILFDGIVNQGMRIMKASFKISGEERES